MNRLLRFAVPAALLLNISPARASFIIKTLPNATGPDPTNSSPSGSPAPLGATNQPVHWKMAMGFGRNIPLAFACRQIVPAAVRVTFGTGVDPNLQVSWKGGDTWNHVLRDTVNPLGLHLEMSHMAVAIEKNSQK